MSDFEFLHPMRIHLIWIALLVLGIAFAYEHRSRKQLAKFISPEMQKRLVRAPSALQRAARVFFVFIAMLLGILSLMQPQSFDQRVVTTYQRSADIMVVLDVSRSMLATDTPPNRLQRAKADLRDMTGALKGHRLGLILFAGEALPPSSPITADMNFFRATLELVNDELPLRVQGGTRIGDAIRAGIKAFPKDVDDKQKETRSKVMLLLTDGEDHESNPLNAAKEAKKENITIITVGFGDEKGSKIVYVDPETQERKTVLYDGVPVKSRLDGETLRGIAKETGGLYIPAGTAVLELDSILSEHIKPLIDEDIEQSEERFSHEESAPLLLGALFFLFLATVSTSFSLSANTPRPPKESA